MSYLTYKKFMENRERITASFRDEITKRMNETPVTLGELAREIGVVDKTIRTFMKGNKISYRVACKIHNYLNHLLTDDISVSRQD